MNIRDLDSSQLARLAGPPGDHQQAALAEQQRRDNEARRAYWAARYIDPASLHFFGLSELTECLQFGRVTQEQYDAEMQRRRSSAARMKAQAEQSRRDHGRYDASSGTITTYTETK